MSKFIEFPCANCGSELSYDSEKEGLTCLHCTSLFPIEKSNIQITEQPIETFKSAFFQPTPAEKKDTYRCKKCGKENTPESAKVFFECIQCGYNIVNESAYHTKSIVPSAIIPFSISKQEALEAFQSWIGEGFWNDGDLKKLSLTEKLEGHYVPFWTFDCHTENDWSGQAGTYYYETETYTDAQGNTQHRSVRQVRWSHRSGNFSEFFNDILICGNASISQEMVASVYPYSLEKLLPINSNYIAGWEASAFDKDLASCYTLSRETIRNTVYQLASNALGGDTQRFLNVDTIESRETYKHIVLPVWICQYLFKGKNYTFVVNGQTGSISGQKPLSTSKIVIAVIIAILIIVAIVMAVNSQ